ASAQLKCWNIWVYLCFGLTTLLLFSSLFFIYKSHYPKTSSPNTSLIYFGTIATQKFDEFKKRTLDLKDEEYLDDLLCQVHVNSTILADKFSNFKIALILLACSIIPWLISIYLSHAYIK
ncbi:MAG TPA: Pycsar system effector family protein, partial [Patescibacteria group bacterium]|nr:Pycsar system effector family protein [Patescibacteria group bacterium]